jgi:peptidoglycan hydrolase-like protein with peptidoglycan-binding domain
VQSDGGTPVQSAAQPNQPQHDQAQLNAQKNRPEQNQQAKGNTNLSPDQAGGQINLSRDQVQRLQTVLNQRGSTSARLTLGPRTRNALIAFQRQLGLEAKGKVDQSTIAALGLSNGAGSATTGQSGAGTRQ